MVSDVQLHLDSMHAKISISILFLPIALMELFSTSFNSFLFFRDTCYRGHSKCQIHYSKEAIFCGIAGLNPDLCYWPKFWSSPFLAWIYTNVLILECNSEYLKAAWKMGIVSGFPRAWTAATVPCLSWLHRSCNSPVATAVTETS